MSALTYATCSVNPANSAKNKSFSMGVGIFQLAEKATIKKQRHEM